MRYRRHDVAGIASKLTDLGSGNQRKLILMTALPGVDISILAKEFQRQTNVIHVDIDAKKSHCSTNYIDAGPEYFERTGLDEW